MKGMDPEVPAEGFSAPNRAFARCFKQNALTLGLVLPIEAYGHRQKPNLKDHIDVARRADALGFAGLWARDVPFEVPNFGDVGQMLDPYVYLGALASSTSNIGLGIASTILPLRHPAHVAKAAATVDHLSSGRMLLGVASGDRGEEYPALGQDAAQRAARFRSSLAYIEAMNEPFPRVRSDWGDLEGSIDLIPKAYGEKIPILLTGGSQQSAEWVARHGDGWMTYPRSVEAQKTQVDSYRKRVAHAGLQPKPVMQSLYIDLVQERDAEATPIHLGFRSGVASLRHYLMELRAIGINHVALNLRFNQRNIQDTLESIAEELFPEFALQGEKL